MIFDQLFGELFDFADFAIAAAANWPSSISALLCFSRQLAKNVRLLESGRALLAVRRDNLPCTVGRPRQRATWSRFADQLAGSSCVDGWACVDLVCPDVAIRGLLRDRTPSGKQHNPSRDRTNAHS